MSYRLLYVTNQDPNGIGGGCYASHAYLKAFSWLFKGNVDLCITDNCNEQDKGITIARIVRVKPRTSTQRMLSVVNGRLHRFTGTVKKLIGENRYDYCVFDHNKLAGSLIKAVKEKGIKVITIHHNYEPEYFKDNCTNIFYRNIYIKHVIHSEHLAYSLSNYNFFLTKNDLEKFIQVYGRCYGKCSIIGTFEFSEAKLPVISSCNQKEITIAITGSLDNEQGIDGVRYFMNDLYPLLEDHINVVIAGKNPTQEIITLCSGKPNIKLVANPTSMNEILSQSQLYLCPTRLGGGLKLRIMDGLRYGLPILTHSCSARGYDLFWDKPYFKVFNKPEDFHMQLNDLLSLITNTINYKVDCQEQYLSVFSFQSGLERIRRAIDF